ncbi:MAG: VanZ family protein [Cyclobacteriaceae bacterium]
MRKTAQFINTYWKSIAWCIIIVWLSLTSSNKIPKISTSIEIDKIAHVIMYLVFSILLIAGFDQDNNLKTSKKYRYLALFIALSIGLLMEILQMGVTETRSAEWLDMLANTIGATLGVLMYPFIKKYFNRLLRIPLIP